MVDTGSVGNLPDYADIAGRLGIPWCAISDEDLLPDGTIKPATKAVREKLEGLRSANDLSVIWPGDLETCLGVPAGQKATPEWQAANTDAKPLGLLRREQPAFVATCEAVQIWLG